MKPQSVFGMRRSSLLTGVSANNAATKIKTPILGAQRLRKTFYTTAKYDSQKNNNNNENLLPNIGLNGGTSTSGNGMRSPITISYE